MLHWFLHLLAHVSLVLAATAPVVVDSGAAGAVIDAGGDGGDGGEGGNEGTDGSQEGADEGEGEGGDEGTSDEGEGGPQGGGKSVKEGKVDWRTVPTEVKTHLTELQKTNPKLANLLQNAVYTSNNFVKAFPEGIKGIQALKTTIEELGGVEEIKTLSSTYKNLVQDQEALDNKARAGDSSVLDTLAEISGVEGFSKLMPSAMSRWATTDRASYNHEMSKVMVNAMREGGIVSDLNLAGKMLKLGTPEAIKEAMACFERAGQFLNGINDVAMKIPEKPKVDPELAKQQQNIETERTKLFNDKFGQEFGSWRDKEIGKQIHVLANGRQLNDYQMRTLGQRIIDDIKDILVQDSDYKNNLQRIYNSRDMAELHKFTRNRTLKLLPEVAKKAYRSLFSGGGTTKKPVAKPGTEKSGAAAPVVVKGWTKVTPDKAPSPYDIDDKKTTFEMKFAKQAILKNGTKVYWGSKIPKEA